MCKKYENQARAIEAAYERLRGCEVVNRIYRLFTTTDGVADLIALFAITDGDVGNEFVVHSDGTISYGDGGPINHVSGIGARGIAAMFGADYAL